jgi:hypothetical protein
VVRRSPASIAPFRDLPTLGAIACAGFCFSCWYIVIGVTYPVASSNRTTTGCDVQITNALAVPFVGFSGVVPLKVPKFDCTTEAFHPVGLSVLLGTDSANASPRPTVLAIPPPIAVSPTFLHETSTGYLVWKLQVPNG